MKALDKLSNAESMLNEALTALETGLYSLEKLDARGLIEKTLETLNEIKDLVKD